MGVFGVLGKRAASARLREDEDDFYRDILSQERQYARTQSFWD